LKALWLILEQALLAFASWTLGYHLCLLLGVAAYWTHVLPLLFYAPGLLLLRPDLRAVLASVRRDRASVAATLLLAVVLATTTLVAARPDRDDLSVFHRPLNQVERMDAPIAMQDTMHDVEGLPLYSVMFGLTSYEALLTYNARLVGVDPLWAGQHAGGVLAALLFACTYVLLYRSFGLSRASAVGGAWVAAGFLLLDGNVHFAFGHFAFLRLNQGKVVLIALGLPLVLLCVRRYWIRPTRRRALHLLLAGVCAVGLSGSGLFLLPLLVLAASGAYVAGYWPRIRLRRALAVNVASVYPLLIVLAIVLRILEPPASTLIWDHWTETWSENLLLVLEGPRTVARNVAILVALPLAALAPLQWRFVLAYSLALVVGFANPVTGPFVMDQVHSAAYWRLLYLFPLPLCAGLAFDCIVRARAAPLLRGAAVAVTVLATGLAFEQSVFAEARLKAPSAYRFAPVELAFARDAEARLPLGALVLGPSPVVQVLALLRPDLRFESVNWTSTLHVFLSADRPAEARERIAALAFVEQGRRARTGRRGFAKALERGVAYVITGDAQLGDVTHELTRRGRTWTELVRSHGRVLLAVRD
jgi:hypothetical protein